MQRRWIVGIALAAAAGAALYVMTRPDAASGEAAKEPAHAPVRDVPAARRGAAAPPRDVPAARAVEPALPPGADPSPGVRKWKEPGLPGHFREIMAPDDSENVEEKLLYKKRRLRFRLTDAAATCYDGPDGREHIALAYTLQLRGGELTVENVRVLEDTIRDARITDCIVAAVKAMRSSAPELPDLREAQETTISLHDLFVRNKSVD